MGGKPRALGRCTGHCCRAFPLPFGPEELAAKAWGYQDGEQIAAMAIYLGQLEGPPEPHCSLGPAHYYTCKNLQDNGDCGIYDDRPQMCRGYPYGGQCGYTACTSQDRVLSPTGAANKPCETSRTQQNQAILPVLQDGGDS